MESFQQDTPPSSAGSLVAHPEMDLMDLKPVMSSPSHQDVFTYSSMCEYQADNRLLVQHRPKPLHEPDAEVLAVLEPISHGGRPLQNAGQAPSDLYWNEVLGDQDLELDGLYRYRPEDSISSVVNTALALNDDLFSSDGSSSDLPTELDLVQADHIDMNQAADWWGFQQPATDVAVTPLLSISVPFGNAGGVPISAPNAGAVLTNGNGVFINGYVQNGTSYVVDRQALQQQQQHQQQHDLLQNQSWAECKAGLEGATLDLDDLGDLDPVHAY